MINFQNYFKLLVAVSAISVSGPSLADDRASLLKKGAQKLSPSQVASMSIGKTFKGQWFYKDQKGNWTSTYSNDGYKHVKVDGKQLKRGSWTYDGKSKWCETRTSKVEFTCADPGVYKHRNTCYGFHEDGSKRLEWRC